MVWESYGNLCTPYTLKVYNSGDHRIMGTENNMLFWLDDMSAVEASFVGFLQLYSDNKGKKLKEKELIACSVDPILLRFFPCWHKWLTSNGHTVVGFL